jgi:hypothetical protein
MKNLTLADLALALCDLFTLRSADLQRSAAGKLYGPVLASRRAALEDLPEALRYQPISAELAAADARHDAFGSALFSYTEAILTAADSSEGDKRAALLIREAFLPTTSALTDSFTDQAPLAKQNRPKLKELDKELHAFPLPRNKTLFDWARAFLDAGDALDALLSQRSHRSFASAGRGHCGKLRSDTLAVLQELRAALRREIAQGSLPASFEDRIFSYFDALSALHQPTKTHAAAKP